MISLFPCLHLGRVSFQMGVQLIQMKKTPDLQGAATHCHNAVIAWLSPIYVGKIKQCPAESGCYCFTTWFFSLDRFGQKPAKWVCSEWMDLESQTEVRDLCYWSCFNLQRTYIRNQIKTLPLSITQTSANQEHELCTFYVITVVKHLAFFLSKMC